MKEYIIRTDAELRVENGRFTLVYDGSCVHKDMVKELPPHGRLIDIDRLIIDIQRDRITPYINAENLVDFLEVYANLDKSVLISNKQD